MHVSRNNLAEEYVKTADCIILGMFRCSCDLVTYLIVHLVADLRRARDDKVDI